MDMRCAVFHGPGDLRLERRDLRALSPDECLIKVKVCGICGTDIHAYRGETTYVTPRVILGHEFSGCIERTGERVTKVRAGDRVTVEPNVECGVCSHCRAGNIRLCTENKPYGINLDGAFAEYVIARQDRIFKIPDELSFEEAAFVEPVSNVVNGVDLAEIHPGDSVVIIGGGPAGLQFVQMAKAAGADPLILLTRGRWKTDLAKRLGADHVLTPGEADVRGTVLHLTAGLGAHVAIDAVGGAFAVELAFELIRAGGRIIMYGVPPQSERFSIPAFEFLTQGKRILSCWLNPYCFERSIDVLAKKIVDTRPLTTHQYALGDIILGFDTVMSKPEGFIKAQVIP